MKPTEEQLHAVSLGKQGKSLKIEAAAGAAKTTTLNLTAQALGLKKGLYVAFNRAIADEAQRKFPSTVMCRTGHSLAFRQYGKPFDSRLNMLLNGGVIASALRIPDNLTYSRDFTIGAKSMAYLVLSAVNRYCQSADPGISIKHVPWDEIKHLDPHVQQHLSENIKAYAQQLWQAMINPNGTLPVTHDVYLKLWQLSAPRIRADYILFDEAQDANGVMLDIVMNQDAQLIFVGDPYQQIYSWRGAQNAMRQIDLDATASLTQSFRFGRNIAIVANKILNNFLEAGVNIRGFDQVPSRLQRISKPDAIICRTNGDLVANLVNEIDSGKRIGVTGGTAAMKSLLRGIGELQAGLPTNCRELALFQSWEDLVEYSESSSGQAMKSLIKQVKEHGVDNLLRILDRTVDTTVANLVLTSAHKAKGLEWDYVKLGNDFTHPLNDGWQEEEANLLYVAATRAKLGLDPYNCEAVMEAVTWNDEKAEQARQKREAGSPMIVIPEKKESPRAKVASKTHTRDNDYEPAFGYS